MVEVGIDGIEIHPGKLRLDLPETFAPEMGETPDKYRKGLDLYASSFPDTHEDIVTMGANASYRLLQRKDLTPEDIGRIDVATESSFDNSKPVSTYIAGCLEQVFDENFNHANKGERKFACIAGTQSLDDAYNWIRAGRNGNRSALVIATDTALYSRGDAGEATQGAGAVAMLISENPSITELSPAQVFESVDENDFLKPNQQFPSVDGNRSIQLYLARMREALSKFESTVSDLHPDDFAYVPFHTPYPGMVHKAARLGYRRVIRGTDVEEALADDIGNQPRPEMFNEDEQYQEALKEYVDDLTETDYYQNWNEQAIEPTLSISRHVGNWYTGSVHIARASGLIHAFDQGRELADKQLLVASYGGGAQAEIHIETVKDRWKEEIGPLDIYEQLDARYDLSFEEYEWIHDVHNHDVRVENCDEFTTPSEEFIFDGWGRMGERQYTFV